jgi:hypothetical protein
VLLSVALFLLQNDNVNYKMLSIANAKHHRTPTTNQGFSEVIWAKTQIIQQNFVTLRLKILQLYNVRKNISQ